MPRLRRTKAQLELVIVELLEKIPLSTYAIAKHLNMTSRTAKRVLKFLEKMERVEALKEEYGTYWRIKK